MSKEKQIERDAMEKVIADAFMADYNIGCDPCPGTVADALYLENYRKQIEGEWIFKEYGEDTYTNLTRIYECSLCGRTIECLNEADEPYCHCGAKMKGGKE
jgi:hypothetical protein